MSKRSDTSMVGVRAIGAMACLILLFSAAGCPQQMPPAGNTPVPSLTPVIQDQKEDVATIKARNDQATADVKQAAVEVQDKGGEPLKPTAAKLHETAGRLDANGQSMDNLQKKLEAAERRNQEIEKSHAQELAHWKAAAAKADAAAAKAQSDAASWAIHSLRALIVLGVVLIAGGVVAALCLKFIPGLGRAIAAGGAVLLAVSTLWLKLLQMEWLWAGLGIIFLLLVAAAAWMIYRALHQTVATVEAIKPALPPGTLTQASQQTTWSQALVRKIRDAIGTLHGDATQTSSDPGGQTNA